MSEYNEMHPSQYPTHSVDYFTKYGHPGRFFISTIVSGSTTEFSSSATFGAGGLLLASGALGSVTMSGGGAINLADLAPGVIHELSIASVTETAGKFVYVLRRNNRIV